MLLRGFACFLLATTLVLTSVSLVPSAAAWCTTDNQGPVDYTIGCGPYGGFSIGVQGEGSRPCKGPVPRSARPCVRADLAIERPAAAGRGTVLIQDDLLRGFSRQVAYVD